MGFEVHVIW